MLLGPHILVGAAVAASTQNPILGILFAFLSHFVLDRIPHWEYSAEPLKNTHAKGLLYAAPILRRVALDITAGFILLIIAVAISSNDIPFTAWAFGGFFGILPDGLSFLLFIRKKDGRREGYWEKFLKIFYHLHQKIHFDKKMGLPPLRIGLSTQAIAALLALYFIIF